MQASRRLFRLRPDRPSIRRDGRGTAAIELAIGLPVFITMMFGVTEFGRLLWTQSELQYAVEQAARCAAVNTTACGTVAQTQSYAASMVFGTTVPASTFSVSTPSCGTEVSASLAFAFAVPNLFPYTITLTAQSCRPS